MASGFKQVTVNASDVAATLTDYPSYFNPTRAGATTLTDAQSGRLYADSGKVVEWAREIVSETEGHTLIPSLTTTTQMFFDYDGVRADYAVTDTYGRNAVWADYGFVSHDGGATDSSANITPTANGGVTGGGDTGVIGSATDFDGTDDYYNLGIPTAIKQTGHNPYTVQAWYRRDGTQTRYDAIYTVGTDGGGDSVFLLLDNAAATQLAFGIRQTNATYLVTTPSASTLATDGVFEMWHGVLDDVADFVYLYKNGSQVASLSATNYSIRDTGSSPAYVAAHSSTRRLGGGLDEVRVKKATLSANWITTEYNNQSDEAGFWGTWTDAQGGATRRVFVVS